MHVHPQARTIFAKSHVELRDWLWVGLMMLDDPRLTSQAIAEEIDVTYKTAWRMRREIKGLLGRLV